jgi:hypothetical protein
MNMGDNKSNQSFADFTDEDMQDINTQDNQGNNLTQEDRVKGGQNSHKNQNNST